MSNSEEKNLYPLLQVNLLVVVGQNDPAEQNNSLLLPTSAQIFAPPQVWFGFPGGSWYRYLQKHIEICNWYTH